jgi:hypothetical protein
MAKPRLNSVAAAVTAFGLGGVMRRYWGGGEVLWVGNRTGLPAGTGEGPHSPLSSVFGTGGALSKLQGTTGRGHVIFVMQGHAESVAAADAASLTSTANSFAIVGLGEGTDRPSFTWTIATSTWLLDTTNVAIDNCRLFLAGAHAAGSALTVAAPITVSAAGCAMRNNEIYAGFDVDQIVTIGITTTAAGTDFVFDNNRVFATATAIGTTFMQLVGASRSVITNNRISYPTSAAAVGPILCLTTASLELDISNNFIHNNAASSTACITGMAGAGGVVALNRLRNEDGASLAHIANTSAIWSQYENYGVNVDGERGAILGVVSA